MRSSADALSKLELRDTGRQNVPVVQVDTVKLVAAMPRLRRSYSMVGGCLALAAVAAVVWFGLQPAPSNTTGRVARPGAPAPQIALPVVGGGMSDLSADRGKVVLVNFCAT